MFGTAVEFVEGAGGGYAGCGFVADAFVFAEAAIGEAFVGFEFEFGVAAIVSCLVVDTEVAQTKTMAVDSLDA